uniref:DUF1758 domain-containing protein n=1 Tax=Haemonchus contortus TaxID=6289 RepID=A0A7I5E619_HAECO
MDYRNVTLLLDSGAQRSFIKSSFAASLRLPSHSATLSTAAEKGKLRKTSQSDKIRITLKSHRGSKKLKHIPVFTKDKLIAPTRTAKLSEVDRCFITKNRVPIAQRSLNPANVSPDILIGQDLLHRILDHNSAAIQLPSGLMLTPTIFGYTIPGTSTALMSAAMMQLRDAQCSSLLASAPVISSKGGSKTELDTSRAGAPLANIRYPIPIRRSAGKVRLKQVSKIPLKGTRQPTTLRPLSVSQDDQSVLWTKKTHDMFYDLLDIVDGIKRKLDRMEDCFRRIDEKMHTLDFRTPQVTQTEMLRPDEPQYPTVPTARCCEVSTERVVQRPINRLIPLEIHSSMHSSHVKDNESSTYGARVTTSRKPLLWSRKKADNPVRRQPVGAAKNQASLNTSLPS